MIEVTRFTCPKCERTVEPNLNGVEVSIQEGGVIHCINLGEVGYGSRYDGLDVGFYVCDKCLFDWIESFKAKPKFIKDGNKQYERMREAYDKRR